MSHLNEVITMLAEEQPLPAKIQRTFTDRQLQGFPFECHVEPDWLLIYERCSDELVLLFYTEQELTAICSDRS